VAIIGGGLAGQTLARQLVRRRPALDVLIIEKATFPVPEAAFKVGESTVEYGTHYFANVLDLHDHLTTEHLPKFGLRFFGPTASNADIAERPELGMRKFPPIPSFQLDRGRLENELARLNRDLGVQIAEGCAVNGASIDRRGHTVRFRQGRAERTVSCRWLVDASGRTGFLRRRLGLREDVAHDANAAWLRIADRIRIDDWSEDEEWRGQIPDDDRWLSTVHLTGRGYWAWLIPLGSGSTSVGLVADPRHVPFEAMNRFPRLQSWLEENEPQLAEAVSARAGELQDFHALKHYAHGCRQVFSADRWFITGVAGAFHDPLYSPGSDFIGLANTFITRLIELDLDGDSFEDVVPTFDFWYIAWFRSLLSVFEGQYPLLGDPQVMPAKAMWDTTWYLAALFVLFRNDCSLEVELMQAMGPDMAVGLRLNQEMQAWLRNWDLANTAQAAGVPSTTQDHIDTMYAYAAVELEPGPNRLEALREIWARGMGLLATMAKDIVDRIEQAGCVPPGTAELRESIDDCLARAPRDSTEAPPALQWDSPVPEQRSGAGIGT
jgi:flavin-dependent dehydrogenase